MKMKKLAVLLSIAISLPISIPTSASGFPVVDLAGFTQRVTAAMESAQEFKSMIEESTKQTNEIKNQSKQYKSMSGGHYSFEDILNDPYISDFMDSNKWNDNDIHDLREESGLKSEDPAMQAHYDNLLRQQKLQTDMYDSSMRRNRKMQDLMGEFSTADNPAKKEDIRNSMVYEQMLMQNDALTMGALTSILEEQRRNAFEYRMRETEKLLLGEGIPFPPTRPLSDYQ